MWTKIKRLFTIKTKFEAFLIIYALALGATERGVHYMQQYPGYGGMLLALACTGAVFMAGGRSWMPWRCGLIGMILAEGSRPFSLDGRRIRSLVSEAN